VTANDGSSAIRPGAVESCDAIDNNCNGQVDEGSGPGGKMSQNCYSGPTGTQGLGRCLAGLRVCNATVPGMSSFGACMGEVVPTAEVCNGMDDDCDGVRDDGFDQDSDGFLSCAACNNAMNCDCNDQNISISPGAVEICDTVDQNCDGRLDDVPSRKCFSGPNVTPDTFTGTCPGPTCSPKGACVAGTQLCSVQGSWSSCGGSTLPSNHPSQNELVCNSVDDDCDGTVDEGQFDLDMDGVRSCSGDCVDTDPGVKPGLPEICDGKDNDCNGTIDGVSSSCYSGPPATRLKGVCRDGTQQCINGMGMGMGTCQGEVLPTLFPDGGLPLFVPDGGVNEPELVCDGRDEDCDGIIDDGYDLDRDGVTTCAGDCDDADRFNRPGLAEVCDCHDNNCNTQRDEGNVCRGAPCHDFDADAVSNCAGDCDDGNAAIGPHRTEVVGNSVDDDCDGAVDEDTDEDGDGYSTAQNDCNDQFAAVNPGAVEICDGVDNDCDGLKDEGFDVDGDLATTCAGDCDDSNPACSPLRREICNNGVDENCDGRIDEDTDTDADSVSTCQGDCNDLNAAVHPMGGNVSVAMEICDGLDNDCDGPADEGFDNDQDSFTSCSGDCDDQDSSVNPGAPEVPANGKDDNCNGRVDEGANDGDGDGFTAICGDCNDADPNIHPHATEVCDRVDNNCDAYVDSALGQFSLCQVCFDADQDGQTNCDGDCNDVDPSISRGAPESCDGKDNDCDGATDLHPLTGVRVCTSDGGFNDAPVATAQSVTTAEDTAASVMLAGADVDGDVLTFAIGSQPTHGTLTGTAPNLTYTPQANYAGADTFTFTVHDGSVSSAVAPVSLSVTAVNDAPVATAQSVTTAEDTAVSVMLAGADVDGDVLTFAIGSQPTHGTLSGTAPNLTYTPQANYAGADSFTFTVNDSSVSSAVATVSLSVTAVNDAPLATAQSVTTAEDTAISVMLAGADVDGDVLAFAIVAQPTHGTLSGTAPNLTYTPQANYAGADSFTFTVNDSSVSSAVATVSLSVTPVNDAPEATAQSVTTAEDTAVSVTLSGADVEGQALAFAIVTAPAHGSLSGAAPSLTYTPAPCVREVVASS
jgi:hypothetical protein